MQDKDQTVAEALGLGEDWNSITRGRIEKLYQINDTIHEAGLAGIRRMQAECFGEETVGEISEYEKKVMMTGYLLAAVRNDAMLKGMAIKAVVKKLIEGKDVDL
jgi:hypothetical protein